VPARDERASARFRFAFIHSFTYAPLTVGHFLRSWNESSNPRASERTHAREIAAERRDSTFIAYSQRVNLVDRCIANSVTAELAES
jgi:hypothetical protein